MANYKNIYVASTVLFLIVLITILIFAAECKLTDNEAIIIANKFYNKMSVGHTSKPFMPSKSIPEMFVFGTNYKKVVVGPANNNIVTNIDCNSMEVIHFMNSTIQHSAQNKYTISHDNKLVLQWPTFMSEQKAEEIIMSFANRIGLPRDFEYSKIGLDKNKGLWTARWKRKFNGIEFEDDYIIISVMAIDGELYGYTKWLKGKPCATEAKVSKAEAIEVANKEFADHFTKDIWAKNKDKFEVKTAELKIVPDKTIWKRILSLNCKSRLAWVIEYDTKKGMERDTVGILNEDVSIIRIDAATKEILSSEINVVR